MDKIRFDFFEFFGAVVPGIPVFIISSFIISGDGFSFDVITAFLKNVSIQEIAIILLACYCIGFCMHYLAYKFFQKLVVLWGEKRTQNLPVNLGKREKELTMIRHTSPDNFKLIDKFFALRQMAYTMFFTLLLFFSFILYSAILNKIYSKEIIISLFLSAGFSFLFLLRAVDFHARVQHMITEASALCKTLKE
jgi:hypothetical protein